MKKVSSRQMDSVMFKIVETYRDKNVCKFDDDKFNLFIVYSKTKNMKYSEFLNIIYLLELKGYIEYIPADSSSQSYNIRGEKVRQDFVRITNIGKTFPEDHSQERFSFFKKTVASSVIAAIIGILLSTGLLNWLWQKLLLFLSLLHF